MRKPRTRQEMIEYLSNHFRYFTMSSWNLSDSYAKCVKLHRLKFPSKEVERRAYDMFEVEEAFSEAHGILNDFDARHKYEWQIASNGRSSGYLVLIRGGTKPSGYKSYCTECGQKNFALATDEHKRCGSCGEHARRNYEVEPVAVFTQPGLGTDDESPDYESWDTPSLKDRVDLVLDFDQTVEQAVGAFIAFCTNYTVEEKEIMVPKTIRIAKKIKENK